MGMLSRFAIAVALISLLASLLGSLPARAQPVEVEVEMGASLICDTQKQVERFVAVFDGNAERAANVVNDEEHDPTACVVATVSYVRGPEIATARTRTDTFRIVRILVLGVLTERGMATAGPAAFYSIRKVEEVGV